MDRPLKLHALTWQAMRSAVRGRPAYFGVLLLFLIGFAVLLALAQGAGVERTLLVDARTESVLVEFRGDSNAWPIGGAVLCTPRELPAPRAERGDAPCDPRLYEVQQIATGFLAWGDGDAVDVTLDPAGRALAITVIRSSSHLPRTRFVIPVALWRSLGALAWIGSVTLGRQATSGETGLLVEGTFEAREVLSFLPEAMRTTEVVKTGVLRSGEAVSPVVRLDCPSWLGRVMDRAADANCGNGVTHLPATAFGHVTLHGVDLEGDQTDGLRVVALTAPGNTALSVAFAGAERPALVQPNWIDRLTTSPLVSAIATALAVAVGLMNLANSFGNATHGVWRDREMGGQADPDPAGAGSLITSLAGDSLPPNKEVLLSEVQGPGPADRTKPPSTETAPPRPA